MPDKRSMPNAVRRERKKMPLGLLGKKLGMSQIFDSEGRLVPVTYIEAGPCTVLQKKTSETDGYCAVQLGFGTKKEKNTAKAELGHYAKANAKPARYVREFRCDENPSLEGVPEVGASVNVTLFKKGDHIDVVGVSKGRGFASPIKRWHVHRGPETHGSMYHRRQGSQGASSYPSRTWKNKRSAGHMGASRVTALNLVIVDTDEERNLILVRGSVPGYANSMVIVRPTVRAKKATHQLQMESTRTERMAASAAKKLNPMKASKKGGK